VANRFTPPRPRQPGSAQEIRSQLALELILNAYALGAALIIFRALLKSLGVDSHLWVGGAIYGITDLLARPLSLVPGADTIVAGELTLADATLLAGVVLFPLGFLVVGSRRNS
jgi:hypothetical protein